MVEIMNTDEEKILSALGHRIRRNIIKILAEEGPKGFTELMNKVGVKDTGTMTFHLKKLKEFIEKNRDGEYQLTDLGRQAYSVLQYTKSLRGGKEQAEEHVEVRREEKHRIKTHFLELPRSISKLDIELVGGSLEITQSDKEPSIEIYMHGSCDFDIDTEHKYLGLEFLGCSSRVLLPRDKLEEINIEIAGGKIEFNNPEGFRKASIEISGGTISLASRSLGESELSIESSGGVADIKLEYSEYRDESTISVEVDGSIIDLEVTVPDATLVKLVTPTEHIGSIISTKIDPDLLEVAEPKRILRIEAKPDGGIIRMKVSKKEK